MNAETITSRIHDKADKELKARIETVIAAFGNALRDAGVQPYHVDIPIHRNFVNGLNASLTPEQHKLIPEQIRIGADKFIDRLGDAAFQVARDANRTKAVDSYMQRVDELSARVDELQQSVEEVRQ